MNHHQDKKCRIRKDMIVDYKLRGNRYNINIGNKTTKTRIKTLSFEFKKLFHLKEIEM